MLFVFVEIGNSESFMTFKCPIGPFEVGSRPVYQYKVGQSVRLRLCLSRIYLSRLCLEM